MRHQNVLEKSNHLYGSYFYVWPIFFSFHFFSLFCLVLLRFSLFTYNVIAMVYAHLCHTLFSWYISKSTITTNLIQISMVRTIETQIRKWFWSKMKKTQFWGENFSQKFIIARGLYATTQKTRLTLQNSGVKVIDHFRIRVTFEKGVPPQIAWCHLGNYIKADRLISISIKLLARQFKFIGIDCANTMYTVTRIKEC